MINIANSIIYEDKEIIICHKQSGWLSQSDRSFDVDMVSALMSYRVSKKEQPYVAIINRLDRPVSGLVLFAKTKESAARLTKELQSNHINKYYYAVVCGKLPEKKGTFVDYLAKDSKTNTSKCVLNPKDGKRAELEYEVIAEVLQEPVLKGNATGQPFFKQTLSLVRIHLITGRHHQIRVQFASRNLPLLGDTKYGSMDCNEDASRQNIGPNIGANMRPGIESNGSRRVQKNISLCAYRLEVQGKAFEISPQGDGFELFR